MERVAAGLTETLKPLRWSRKLKIEGSLLTMKRLIVIGLVFGPALLMGQKKEDIVAIQRDLANLEDEVKQLKTAQDERMAALQTMLQQAVDASAKVTSGLAAMQKEIDAKLNDQQNKLVAPVATLGAKVDQMSNDFSSVSTNVAELMRRMNALESKLKDVSDAVRVLTSPPQPPARSAARSDSRRCRSNCLCRPRFSCARSPKSRARRARI